MHLTGLFICLIAVGSLAVGLIHIGFALTDPAPRNIWDWYVVAMGCGTFAIAIPAARYMAGLQ